MVAAGWLVQSRDEVNLHAARKISRLAVGRPPSGPTIDTYRIAAVEQLRTYAEIMDLPMEVVSTPREMRSGWAMRKSPLSTSRAAVRAVEAVAQEGRNDPRRAA